RWLLLAAILVMVVIMGFFLPPVSIILMTAPIVLPPLRTAGFDLIWFGVLMTIVMEMGLIHPPVGLNIFVIKNIAPDIPLRELVGELAARLLARTDHDVVDVQRTRHAVDAQVQAGIVDAHVLDPTLHAHAALAQQRAADPSGRLGEVLSDLRVLALQEPHLAL